MAEKAWKDMTPAERSAYMRQRKIEKAAERQQTVAPAVDDDALLRSAPLIPEVAVDRSMLDKETSSLLTDADLKKIEARVRAKKMEEAHQKAMDAAEALLETQIAGELGLISPDDMRTEAEQKRLREKVKWRVNLPGGGMGRKTSHFRIDGIEFQNGQVYTTTRAVFESIQETHYRIRVNEIRFGELNQDEKAGISMNNRAVGTTAAHVLYARQPQPLEILEIIDAA